MCQPAIQIIIQSPISAIALSYGILLGKLNEVTVNYDYTKNIHFEVYHGF